MTPIERINACGQSIWLDFISRESLDSGRLTDWIRQGVSGVTSNPTIFMKAITESTAYDDALERILNNLEDQEGANQEGANREPCGFSTHSDGAWCSRDEAIYEDLAIPDIREAADLLRPVHERSGGADGYVSLEVSPKLAHRTQETLAAGKRLFQRVSRPNVMIKVPATEAGLPAIRALLGAGIPVNITLIFSLDMYDAVMRAYADGVGDFLARRGVVAPPPRSVASFFVSRVDTLVDKLLESRVGKHPAAAALMGKAAVANARMAYQRFLAFFGPQGPFAPLRARGAAVQRPLWASTSTKNPIYSPLLYVEELVGRDTVNTVPPQTLDLILKGGDFRSHITEEVDKAELHLAALESLGIYMTETTAELLRDGVGLFEKSFDELLSAIASKRAAVAGRA